MQENSAIARLHIWGQEEAHGDVFLIGNTKALIELRDAIDNAIERGLTLVGPLCAGDGQGYYTAIICIDAPDLWERLALPYAHPDSQEWRDGVVWPDDVILVYDKIKRRGLVNRRLLETTLGGDEDERGDNR